MARNFATGWRQVGSCFVLLASTGFIAGGYSVVAVPLGREFHPSRMVLMLAMTIMAAVSGLLSPFLGSLMDRSSMRRLMLAGTVCLCAGYVALSFASSFTYVLLVFGLLVAPANVLAGPVAATVLLSRWFVRRRGAAIGLAIAGIAVGTVVYPPLIQYLLDHTAWRNAFRVFAVILLCVNVPAALMVVDTPADRGLHPDGAASEPDSDHGHSGATVPARAILTDPAFWIAVVIFAGVLSGVKGMITNLAPLAIDQGIGAQDAAYLISIYGICGLVTKMSFAVIADRIHARTLMFGSLFVFAAGMACLTQARHGFGVIAIGVCLVGIAAGIITPLQSFLVPRIFGRHCVGRAMGLMSTVMLVALLATPPLFGRIYDMTGSYDAVFLTFVVLAAVIALLVPRLRLSIRPQPDALPPAQAEALV